MILLLVGCGTADELPPAPQQEECKTSVLDWSTFGDPFFRSWCTGCHHSALPEDARSNAPAGVDFDTLDGVRVHVDRIRARAIEQATMPPGGGPDQASLALLDEWLRCGADGTTEGIDDPPVTDTAPVDTAPPPVDTGPGVCEHEGQWTVLNVSCGGTDITDVWFSSFTATEFTVTPDGDDCAIEYLRRDAGCEEVQVWRSDLASPYADVTFQAVTSCVPAACAFSLIPNDTCEIGPIGIDTVLPVTELQEDMLQLGPFSGSLAYCSSMSFQILRVP